MTIFLYILGTIVSLILIGLVVNSIFFKNELKAIEPYGEMIEVNESKMHLFAMGSGKKTIVLLPGYGVSLPSADFGPLMRKLSQENTVVSIEYFGVGFSKEVDTPRTNENYLNEIRTVLNEAGFKPPYILMPHSASGIYSEYYAAKFPEEVAAIIMLDTTSSSEISKMPAYLRLLYKVLFLVARFQQATCITRILFKLVPETKLLENGYSKKEIRDYRVFNYHVINNTMIKQNLFFMENIKEVNGLAFPKDLPVLKIISQDSLNSMAKKDKKAGMEYQKKHLSRLGEKVSYEVLEGTHLIYQTQVDEIVRISNDFLDNIEVIK